MTAYHYSRGRERGGEKERGEKERGGERKRGREREGERAKLPRLLATVAHHFLSRWLNNHFDMSLEYFRNRMNLQREKERELV